MRLMVLGNETIAQKMTIALAVRGIEVVSTSDSTQALAQLKEERVDLAAIDASLGEIEMVCNCIAELFDIPLVLIVDESDADWEKLQSPDTDGYISAGASGAEMAARLQAVVRRWASHSRSSLNAW